MFLESSCTVVQSQENLLVEQRLLVEELLVEDLLVERLLVEESLGIFSGAFCVCLSITNICI